LDEDEGYPAPERPILLAVPDRFEGQRVVVRVFGDDDVAEVYAAIRESLENLQPWLPFAHLSLEDEREFIRRAQARFLLREGFDMGIFARDGGAFLGGVGLHVLKWGIPSCEIGYWVRLSAQGRGYVSEAVRLMTGFAFDGLGAQRVVIRCDARNARSAAVAERLGYALEGRLRRDSLDTSGHPRDTLIYAMIRDDYDQQDWT